MKVKELIAKLAEADPEAIVIVDGYEEDYNEAERTSSCHVQRNPHHKSWCGDLQIAHKDMTGSIAAFLIKG